MKKNINYVWNWETIRDYCGAFYMYQFMLDVPDYAVEIYHKYHMIYRLPDVVNDVIKIYHKQFVEGDADKNIEIIKSQILNKLEGVIPLDGSRLWQCNDDVTEKVYSIIFVRNPIFERIASTYYRTDKFKAQYNLYNNRLANNIDEEVFKILSKAVNKSVNDKYIDKGIFDMPFNGIR